MDSRLTDGDREQIRTHGLTVEAVEEQLIRFEQGYPRTQITQAVRGEGCIRQVADEEMERYIAHYDGFTGTSVKFVPASGAATRMFKPLYDYLRNPEPDVNPFEESLKFYPFGQALGMSFLRQGVVLSTLEARNDYSTIIHRLLDPGELGYGKLPKLLIPFHRTVDGGVRTALEEHLVEGAQYARGHDGVAHMVFTVSPQHKSLAHQQFERVRSMYESTLHVQYDVRWTTQNPSTDTIAVNLDRSPYRDAQGKLVFRPAGHGALLENLEELDQDLIFIKNVDNVAPDRLKPETVRYKKTLAGILLKLRSEIYAHLARLDEGGMSEEEYEAIQEFCRRELSYRLPTGIKEVPLETRINYLKQKLNRPLRVCGVVINEGEPGGGPFWVRERDGSESMQIVETSQLDLEDARVQDIIEKQKYFNPVDIVCCIKDYKGRKFSLQRYVNRNTGFIAKKSIDGTPILALELPGLWNGAMANWNTVFVEVPPITFTPVKEVTDLIRPEHQAESMPYDA
ncbi:MAG: DUF4301 family protein [Bacteroides sp.]